MSPVFIKTRNLFQSCKLIPLFSCSLCRLDQDVDLGFGGPPPNSLPSTSAAGAASFDSNTPPGQPRLATSSEYDAITRSVNVVRQRLCHLERVMRAFVPQSGEFDENGQPLFGINMDLLAATATMSREQSVGYEGGGTGGGAMAATPGLPIPPQDSYNGHGGGEYESKAGFQDPRFSLPPAPMPLERIRDSESERRMADSDGEVEAAVTLEYLVCFRSYFSPHLILTPCSRYRLSVEIAKRTISIELNFADPKRTTNLLLPLKSRTLQCPTRSQLLKARALQTLELLALPPSSTVVKRIKISLKSFPHPLSPNSSSTTRSIKYVGNMEQYMPVNLKRNISSF